MKKQKKTNVALNLPCIVEFGDYHEISRFDEQLKQLSPKLKCDEIPGSSYAAIVYTKKDKAYKDMIKQHNSDYISDPDDSDA